MEYHIAKDKIIIDDKSQFNSRHILECGQIFRYKKINDMEYIVFSGDEYAVVKEEQNGYEILTNNVKYFENFFDLTTDYSSIKNILSAKNETLKKACQYGFGIRILKQQKLEMIISFIISANNNIKRIQTLVERLCEKCGNKIGEYFAFPTLEQIETLSIEDFRKMGMGFRAKYIYNTAKILKDVDLEVLENLSSKELTNYLQSLSGVGPKVADCIALFAYQKMDCFPVDTWVQKIYNCYFSNTFEDNRQKIRGQLVKQFENLSGYAQQYLFFYRRELDKKNM